MFVNELQILVRKIVAQKPEFLGEGESSLETSVCPQLRDPYFRVVARGQC